MPLQEDELIQRAKQGNIEAFEELIGKYQQKIYNTAYRMVGNYHDALDISQEAIIRIYKSLGGFRGEAAFSTWIYHITANACRDELRRKYRHFEGSLDEWISDDEGNAVPREVADLSHSPEKALDEQEVALYLQTLINQLNPEYRMAMVMREQMNYSYQEIADILQISIGTVKSRISRARKILQEKILADGEHYVKVLRLSGNKEG
ncbi:MAG: sigma-70 family RNA polymerase sigma factor [Clostridiales bacterium]|jgi:RNA polymerase sigma-70 factor (ECF subfamily)|nr:sigma-70 family RNA polymerase sigma factor [Clostridiales bacterium]MDR2711713.1 sigma-70 family RNA polymerase sigma factor [Clostridiales bacterium]